MRKKNYFYFYSAQANKTSKVFQKKHRKSIVYLTNFAGQAIVEYVLILSVLVFVGGGLLFTFNQGVQAWGKALLGTDGYFACLLQTGLLPMQNRSNAECGSPADAAKAFENMDLNISSGGGSSPSQPYTPSTSSGSNNNSNKPPINNPTSSNSSNSTNENGDRYPTSSSRSTLPKPTKSSGRNSSTYQPSGQLLATNNQLNNLEDPASNTTYTKRKGRKKIRRLKIKKNKAGFEGYKSKNNNKRYEQLYSSGYLTEEEEQEQRARKITITGSTKKNNLNSRKKPMRLVKKLKTKQQKGPEVGNWSFGNIFRFVMIIGIIAIIAFLIANQANSVRKSLK